MSKDRSIPAVILNTRRLNRFSKGSLCFSFFLTLMAYSLWIYPVFEEVDVTNSAVVGVVTSKEYQSITNGQFEKLASYNEGFLSEDNFVKYDLHGVQGFKGVVVKFDLNLVPASEERVGGGHKYKYESVYRLSLNFGHLVLFLIVEACILLFGWYFLLWKPPAAQIEFEEDVLRNFFAFETDENASNNLSVEERIELLLRKFHRFAKDLSVRQRNRPALLVEDEYDVQYLVFALLRMYFSNVKSEDVVPSVLGGGSRVDFLIPEEELVVEVKMARAGMSDRTLGDELIRDVARYHSHPACKTIVFFVYDPNGHIRNPTALKKEFRAASDKLKVIVVFAPEY
ncbi:hypothetical protein [Pseudomonas allokribbensis]|uniref:PD-(D/E)XK nuclease domain-containing protein n=1 Tax=Pseudomonas allokribbensis TaxID=2774460 RepID=UPI001ABC013A|nr:hypothetical protein [Pseudomonas allokribbensis]